jgi:hypothetical protein
MIRNSLGSFVYALKSMFLSSTAAQINTPVRFMKYDSNGNMTMVYFTPMQDPYQQQNTLFYDLKQYDAVIDGRNSIEIIMRPLTTLTFKIFVDKKNYSELLGDDTNMIRLETAMGSFEFYKDYVDDSDKERTWTVVQE